MSKEPLKKRAKSGGARHSTKSKARQDKDWENLCEQVENLPAQISKDQMALIEHQFVVDYGAMRRAALACLTQSIAQLRDGAIDDREYALALAEVAEGAGIYSQRLKDFADMMSGASFRAMAAVCYRADGCEMLREVRVKNKQRMEKGAAEVAT